MSAKRSRLLCVLVLLLSPACDPSWHLAKYDRDIADATKAIEAARGDGELARAYTERGRGYSEKARYSRVFNLIDADEYGRLFDLAIEDHDRAVALAPDQADVYVGRGRTYYDRAAAEDPSDPETRVLFASAEADYSAAIERDGRNAHALDMLGIVHSASGDYDRAIVDFTREMAIEQRLGRMRLAEAHCRRGSENQKAGHYEQAISDYEKAIDLGGASSHGCDCQPESPLAWIYYETQQYDKSWEVVKQARRSHRFIAPELIAALETATVQDR